MEQEQLNPCRRMVLMTTQKLCRTCKKQLQCQRQYIHHRKTRELADDVDEYTSGLFELRYYFCYAELRIAPGVEDGLR